MYQPNNQFPTFEATTTQGRSGGTPPVDHNPNHDPNILNIQVSASVAGEDSTLVDHHNTELDVVPNSSSREANTDLLALQSDYYRSHHVEEDDEQNDFETKSGENFSPEKEHYAHFPLDHVAMTMPPLTAHTGVGISTFPSDSGQKVIPSLLDASSLMVMQQQQHEDEDFDKSPFRKQKVRMNGIWQKHLEELKEYRDKHGHVSVPRKSGPLGEW
jgi:hypothetical protein